MIRTPQYMHDRCDLAKCEDDGRELHVMAWMRHGFNCHPDQGFAGWWQPTGLDPDSGASVGGHPDARRVWARKDSGGWKRYHYGIDVITAWNTARFRLEFHVWQKAGSPEREPEFVSIALPLMEQKRRLQKLILETAKPLPGLTKETEPF